MSGIFGIYHCDQHLVKSDDLNTMMSVLAHRGPDDAGIWYSGPVGLGHCMLWSTPESLLEKLPAVVSGMTITADSRIDNRESLIAELGLEGSGSVEKITDSDLILAAYEKWGEQCPDKLLGDFSFAIWDSKKQKLFCVRDHFGVRPFYYYASDSRVIFATEIKAILCNGGVPKQLNEQRIGDYMSSMFHDVASTSYKDIFRLPPAHSMTVTAEGITLHEYWKLDPERELPPASDEAYALQLREIFTEAVRCRLRSAFKIGTTLSGGLDSSSITCVARNLLSEKEVSEKGEQPLHAFSAVFDELPDCDERKYIDPVLAQGPVCHHAVQGNRLGPLDCIEEMFWHQDEAFYAPNWFMSWQINEEVQKQGVRVLLDGFDGDTTVSYGYGYLSELAQAGKWLRLIRESTAAYDSSKSGIAISWQYINYYGIQPHVKRSRLLRALRKIRRHISSPCSQPQPRPQSSSQTLLNSEFVRQTNLNARIRDWKRTQGHAGLPERERHYRNIAAQGMPAFALELKDKAAAAFGFEIRYPFWDKRLVEFCLALPSEQKMHLGWDRVVMRRAMTNILPKEIQWRRGKTDFSSNLTEGLVNSSVKLGEIVSQLDSLENYFDVGEVKKVYQRLLTNYDHQDAVSVWLVASLALWINYSTKQEDSTIKNECDKISKEIVEQVS